jgi:hypothetical protein
MPITKPVLQILTAATITPDTTTALGTAVQLDNEVLIALTVRLTFHASAADGADLQIFSSHNNVHYDTEPYQTISIALPNGGGLAQRTIAMIPAPAWIKVALKNKDLSQIIADATVHVARQEVT